jgi:hypothetical protein
MKNTLKFWLGCTLEAWWWLFQCFVFTLALLLYFVVARSFHVKLISNGIGWPLYAAPMLCLNVVLLYLLVPWDMLFPVELSEEDQAKFDRL